MTSLKNDIELGNKTEEAEERNAPEGKLVEPTDFQSVGADSNPVGSTKDWQVEKMNNGDFNIKKTCATIDGREYNRLSVMT